jgi:hypothetical protein
MFKGLIASIAASFRQETLAERSARMQPGALYGLLAGTVFVLVSSFINIIFFPGIPLGIDWTSLLIQWFEFGIVLAAAGAIVGWFTEDYMGIVWGGVMLTGLLLLGNLVASLLGRGSAALMAQSIITVLPLVGAGVLLAGIIRVAINRHLFIGQQETQEIRRRLMRRLILIVILVGLVPGIFSRFGISTENTIRTLNDNLQNYATDPLLEWRYPYAQVPSLKQHLGMTYKLYVRTSGYEAGSLDITIRFQDGYAITCLAPTDSGNNLFLSTCNEGNSLTSH